MNDLSGGWAAVNYPIMISIHSPMIIQAFTAQDLLIKVFVFLVEPWGLFLIMIVYQYKLRIEATLLALSLTKQGSRIKQNVIEL